MLQLNQNDVAAFEKAIRNAGNTVILSHVNPDGDALGSSTAMLSFMMAEGRNADIILPSDIADTIKFIQDESCAAKTTVAAGNMVRARELISAADLIICLDFNILSRIEELGELVRESKAFKILVDHHPGPETEAFDIVFSRTDVSSASEHLFWILRTVVGGDASRLPERCAYALMSGMTTDSNNFGNSVFPTTLEMASELIAAGVDREDIICNIYNSYSEARLRAMGYILQKMKITPEGVAILTLSQKEHEQLGLKDGDTEGFVNLPLGIRDVRLSIFVRENIDRVRVSLRSKRGTDCNEIAGRYFHGGGHVLASGGKILVGQDVRKFAQVEDYVETIMKEYFAGK